MSETKITFIQTGGTIDKDYPRQTKSWAFEIGEAASKRILEKIDPSFEFEIITAFRKDSLEIDANDRTTLNELINKVKSDKIIITHGTDTMIETAQSLHKDVAEKVIIITGSMRPERFSESDAEFNLGCAVGAINFLNPGIYIAMHGVVKSFQEMKRNMETGKYY